MRKALVNTVVNVQTILTHPQQLRLFVQSKNLRYENEEFPNNTPGTHPVKSLRDDWDYDNRLTMIT